MAQIFTLFHCRKYSIGGLFIFFMMIAKKQPKILISIDCLNRQGIFKGSFKNISINGDDFDVYFELYEKIKIRKGFIDIHIGKIEVKCLRTMYGNCFWALIEIGVYDFINLLESQKVTMKEVTGFTINDEGYTPLEIEYYGFALSDIIFENPNQIALF